MPALTSVQESAATDTKATSGSSGGGGSGTSRAACDSKETGLNDRALKSAVMMGLKALALAKKVCCSVNTEDFIIIQQYSRIIDSLHIFIMFQQYSGTATSTGSSK